MLCSCCKNLDVFSRHELICHNDGSIARPKACSVNSHLKRRRPSRVTERSPSRDLLFKRWLARVRQLCLTSTTTGFYVLCEREPRHVACPRAAGKVPHIFIRPEGQGKGGLAGHTKDEAKALASWKVRGSCATCPIGWSKSRPASTPGRPDLCSRRAPQSHDTIPGRGPALPGGGTGSIPARGEREASRGICTACKGEAARWTARDFDKPTRH